jgi:hypothetical protein
MSLEDWLHVIEVLKWPVAVMGISIAGFFVFRNGIETLMARVQRAALGSKAIDFAEPAAIASEQQQKHIAKPTVADKPGGELPPPPPSPALRGIEESIAAAISASSASEDVKRAWLIRGVAVAQLERAHEMTYRLIMGSQITLLLHANTGAPTDMDVARAIYDEAKTKYPEIYKTFDFDDWIAWPKNSGLTQLEQIAPNRTLIKLTDIGRDFLHHLVNAGLTSPKIG